VLKVELREKQESFILEDFSPTVKYFSILQLLSVIANFQLHSSNQDNESCL